MFHSIRLRRTVCLLLLNAAVAQACCLIFFCANKAEDADVHVAGTPCTDFSVRGLQQGLQGKTTPALFAWIGQRLIIQEKYVLQENVMGFVTDLFQELLGHLYYIQQAVIDPAELGWPIVRKRKFTLLIHKLKAGPIAQPLHAYSRLFLSAGYEATAAHPSWEIFLVSGPRELRGELLWAAGRPQTSWGASDTQDEDTLESLDPLDMTPCGSFWSTLTDSERKFLDGFRDQGPGQVYQLNQNPEFSTSTVSDSERIFTLTKNNGILWSPSC